jgi:phosphoheptose isomerase
MRRHAAFVEVQPSRPRPWRRGCKRLAKHGTIMAAQAFFFVHGVPASISFDVMAIDGERMEVPGSLLCQEAHCFGEPFSIRQIDRVELFIIAKCLNNATAAILQRRLQVPRGRLVGPSDRRAWWYRRLPPSGGKVLACGNGGSSAGAQYLAAMLVGQFERERPGLAALALAADATMLTAVGNDPARILAKQVHAVGQPGDVLVALSATGNSSSVIAAVQAAHDKEMTVVALTGKGGGKLKLLAEIDVNHRAARSHRTHS